MKDLKEFDVTVIAEAECVYRGVRAKTQQEAEEQAKKLWAEGVRPSGGSPKVSLAEVGPAVEVCSPKKHTVI